jgi:hypothetical protein
MAKKFDRTCIINTPEDPYYNGVLMYLLRLKNPPGIPESNLQIIIGDSKRFISAIMSIDPNIVKTDTNPGEEQPLTPATTYSLKSTKDDFLIGDDINVTYLNFARIYPPIDNEGIIPLLPTEIVPFLSTLKKKQAEYADQKAKRRNFNFCSINGGKTKKSKKQQKKGRKSRKTKNQKK